MRFNSNWKALAVWLHMFFSFKWKYDFYRGVKQSFEDKVFFNIKGEIPVFDLLYQTMKLHISKQSEIILKIMNQLTVATTAVTADTITTFSAYSPHSPLYEQLSGKCSLMLFTMTVT